ncbi:MAG: type II toxin-antitoxin system RelE/ParE family toxin [Armatimonadetes bacterium]|nr:type II toxin-antitoxin system RelE/ParE family toxin [Armatimonadota bacterium]
MPSVTVVYFKDADESVPIRNWFDEFVAARDERALAKCKACLKYLRDNGLGCRRPYADYLRDGIYELRTQFGGLNYRILYFFSGYRVAVAAVGLVKEGKVPDKEIDLAIARKKLYELDPERYSYYE